MHLDAELAVTPHEHEGGYNLIMITVAIPFVRVGASQNPNLASRDGRDPVESYFRAMTVAFASIRRWHPTANLEFISNADPHAAYAEEFNRLGVEVKHVPFDHRPPEGFAQRFTASLYLLDALGSLSADETVVIDPDVLCVGPLDQMLGEVEGKVGVLRMDYPIEANVNGISRKVAGELHNLLGERGESPEHYGGEVYVIPIAALEIILARCEEAWVLTLERHAGGLTKFMTEEHILSYAVRGTAFHALNNHVRRVWTAHRFRKVNGAESSLTLWHLPAEKDRGFETLYRVAVNHDSWFWNAPRKEFVGKAGRAMGFHHRSIGRYTKDVVGYFAGVTHRGVQIMLKMVRGLW